MAAPNLSNFDAGQIPDPNDQANFHADAAYVWSHMSGAVIPQMNSVIAWLENAMAGDTESAVDSLAAILTELSVPAGVLTARNRFAWGADLAFGKKVAFISETFVAYGSGAQIVHGIGNGLQGGIIEVWVDDGPSYPVLNHSGLGMIDFGNTPNAQFWIGGADLEFGVGEATATGGHIRVGIDGAFLYLNNNSGNSYTVRTIIHQLFE